MVYLLAKYALLFAATGVLSFLLGRWSLRRQFVDVSATYESLASARAAEEGFWAKLWPRLDELDESIAPRVRGELAALPVPELDNSGVEAKLAAIDKRINDLPTPQPPDFTDVLDQVGRLQVDVNAIPAPPEVDLQPLQTGLRELREQVAAIRMPAPDFAPIEGRIERLEETVRAIPTPPAVNLDPLQRSVDQMRASLAELALPEPDLAPLSTRIDELRAAVSAMPVPPQVDLEPLQSGVRQVQASVAELQFPETDLAPLGARIDALRAAVNSIPAPPRIDLTPITQRLARMEDAVAKIRIPAPVEAVDLTPTNQGIGRLQESIQALALAEAVDLEPVNRHLTDIEQAIGTIRVAEPGPDISPLNARLDSIEEQLRLLGDRLAQPSEPEKVGPTLLDSPSRGPKDDLQRISGVGPALERLLNDNGVYYFWQIASWDEDDVRYIDDRLEVFKGRIARDEWVAQANRLQAAD